MITIVDCSVGNLHSVNRVIQHLGLTTRITETPEEIRNAEVLVMPGQGAFQTVMNHLNHRNLINPIKTHIAAGKPFLGICLGLQILFDTSEENGLHKGLGVFKGTVKPFPKSSLKIPHMGWNTVQVENDPNSLYPKSKTFYYFVHSYYVDTPDTQIISTKTEYGPSFVSSIQTDTLLATQFHPEKSGQQGLDLLKNFFQKVGAP